MCGTEIDARRALEAVIAAAGQMGSGWWVLNTIPLRESRNSDADLIVGIPNSGLLIIEVKGWTKFTVDGQGRWSRPGPNGRNMDMGDGPFVQAQGQEYLLLDLLNRYLLDTTLDRGPLPRIGSCVLFGNLMEAELSHDANDARFTLYRDTFCPSTEPSETEAVRILNSLRTVLGENIIPPRNTDNSVPRLQKIQKRLSPAQSVAGLGAFVNDAHEGLNQLAETAMVAIADTVTDNTLYVEGPAGTGKTVLALKLGLERSRQAQRPSLFICYSQRLAEEIREVRQIGGGTVEIFTPEELLVHSAGDRALDPFLLSEEAAAEAARTVAELMGSTAEPSDTRAYLGHHKFWDAIVDSIAESGAEYGAVLVDEAQDLWEPAFSRLSALVGKGDLFGVFVDPLQTTRRERAGLLWERPESTENGRSISLKRNFRNGDRIIDAVEERFEIGYERPPREPVPAELRLLPYSNDDPLEEVVLREYQELRAAGLDPIVLTSRVSEQEVARLETLEISTNSVESFKGLERRSILLVLGRSNSPLDPNDEDLYVGMTRATVLLSLAYHTAQPPLTLPMS